MGRQPAVVEALGHNGRAMMSIEPVLRDAPADSAEQLGPACSGVYLIVNTACRRAYVGQSVNIRRRWAFHRSALARGKHSNARLQADWHSHGAASFEFRVVALLPPSDALRVEKEITASLLGPDCYNLSAAACPGRGPAGDERMIQNSIRLTPAQWAAVDANGGIPWIRRIIDEAELTA